MCHSILYTTCHLLNERQTRKRSAHTHSTHQHTQCITQPTQVHNKQTFIQYLKHMHQSKCKDDTWMKKQQSALGTATEHSQERWENHTISAFLEAMLSGAGYDPHVSFYEESNWVDKHPRNVWRFMAYLLSLGKVYE